MLKPLSKDIIATRLAVLRRRAKLDQAAVGARVGVHQATVSAWEKGRALPSQDHVEALCKLFNVSEAELNGDQAPASSAEPGSLRELLAILATLDDTEIRRILAEVAAGRAAADPTDRQVLDRPKKTAQRSD